MQITNPQTPSDIQEIIQDLVQKEKTRQTLGQGDFLQLMIAQLANQDPLEPLKDTEFVNQVTQFNILDQVTAFNTALTSLQAFQATNLIDRVVEGQLDSGELVRGTVTEVILTEGRADLVLDGATVLPMENVLRVLPSDGTAA